VKKGSTILCADGSISLEVLDTDPKAGTVRAKCLNTATLGERKNVNLPGVIVDLPTLTEKDIDDLVNWGVPNEIDLIAASFVRKGTDLDYIRQVLGPKGQYIKIISKVENHEGVSNFDEILAKSGGWGGAGLGVGPYGGGRASRGSGASTLLQPSPSPPSDSGLWLSAPQLPAARSP
jgi:pyruvate kinase